MAIFNSKLLVYRRVARPEAPDVAAALICGATPQRATTLGLGGSKTSTFGGSRSHGGTLP